MADINIIKKYRRDTYGKTLCTLGYTSVLMAFINTYGKIYDNNYFALILNLNNIIEHYLTTNNNEIITKLYNIYKKCIASGKTEKETYNELRHALYHLPVYSICEVIPRQRRHSHK